MGMNKNAIFAWASFLMFILGAGLILLGVFKYPNYTIGFTVAGLGFCTISWAFNALKGRI
ncbi:CAL67264 family membrane protein [Aquimarina rhabdastrellae]